MSIQEQLTQQLTHAMKARQADLVTTLRGLQAAVKNKRIELQRDLDDQEVIDVLKTASKQLKDALTDFVKAERTDLIEKTQAELEVIATFLPTPMERVQIREHVTRLAGELGTTTMKDMGKLMGAVMKALGAAAQGEDVKAEVEAYLQSGS